MIESILFKAAAGEEFDPHVLTDGIDQICHALAGVVKQFHPVDLPLVVYAMEQSAALLRESCEDKEFMEECIKVASQVGQVAMVRTLKPKKGGDEDGI